MSWPLSLDLSPPSLRVLDYMMRFDGVFLACCQVETRVRAFLARAALSGGSHLRAPGLARHHGLKPSSWSQDPNLDISNLLSGLTAGTEVEFQFGKSIQVRASSAQGARDAGGVGGHRLVGEEEVLYL